MTLVPAGILGNAGPENVWVDFAETRVLMAPLKGHSLPEYAGSAGLSVNTVHSQAKSLFAKMDVHRQADLVAKVMAHPLLRVAARDQSRNGLV